MSGTDLEGATVPELLMAHRGWARRLARRLVDDTADADDLVQEAMLAGVRRPPAAGRPVRGWLATVMRNLARNRGLAGDRRRAREHEVSAEAGAASSPEEALAVVEMHRLLARLVGELPNQERQMVVMRYFEERTSEEIGQALSLPAGTVRWRLGQAISSTERSSSRPPASSTKMASPIGPRRASGGRARARRSASVSGAVWSRRSRPSGCPKGPPARRWSSASPTGAEPRLESRPS